MVKNSFWLKLIAFVIVQTVLLTCVDFTLASSYRNEDVYKRIALNIQNIKGKCSSQTIDISLVQIVVSGVKLPHFNSKTVFCALEDRALADEGMLKEKACNVSKEIYKAIANINISFQIGNCFSEYLNKQIDQREQIAKVRVQESTAPPMNNQIVFAGFSKPNC